MVPSLLFAKSRLFASEKHAAFVILALCIALRAAPELMAYPYPIGYDVVNYYIPTLTNFEDKWDTVSKQFPFYVTFLYLVSIVTGLTAHSVVVAVVIIMTGIFGISLFLSCKDSAKTWNKPEYLHSYFCNFSTGGT